MIRARMLALLAIGALGCASAGGSGSTRSNPNIITQQEIAQAGTGNAYDMIRRLRPNFMSSRGETTLGNVQNAQTNASYPNVYLDGLAYGDINSLRNIDSSQIMEVRMYPAWEAQTKFGLGNNAGVIAITTHK